MAPRTRALWMITTALNTTTATVMKNIWSSPRSVLGVSRSLHVYAWLSVRLCTKAGMSSSERAGLCVHSETAPIGEHPYACTMELISVKTVLAIAWVSVVCLLGILGNTNSLSGWTLLAAIAVVPPLIMMWRWNDPPQSMSESIQKARR